CTRNKSVTKELYEYKNNGYKGEISMLDEVFNRQFKHFLAQQKREADPKRLEMLNKDLTGTIALLRNVVFPVLGSFDNWKLEHRIVNTAGVSLYLDAYYTPLQLGLECEGFT